MEKQKNTQMLVIAVLSVALLTMSVGFALVTSEVLNINGTVDVAAQQWKVAFDTTSYRAATGSVTPTTQPTIAESTITFDVKLAEIGDFYEFDVDVANTGTFDAELVSISVTDLSARKYLATTTTYAGTPAASVTGNPLLAKQTGKARVHFRIEYVQPDNVADLPAEDVENIPVTISLNYRQKATS